MLNTKKNLLQRVRIAMVAIVTIMGIGGAFAMKAPAHTAAEWGIVSTDPTYYYVTNLSNGFCNEAVATNCSVTSAAMPDSQGRILKTQANLTDKQGDFTPAQ
jgi:hypothetical protein